MIEDFLKVILDKNKEYVIFDIGSRDCLQSIEFYNNFPNAKIYAFECNPNTLDICRKNIKDYTDRITLIEGAICDYNGKIKFYPINQEKTITTWKDGNPGASSLFKSNGLCTIEHYVQDEIYINCHRLDTIMEKYGIDKVDIIWMDLQGAELLALKSLGNKLKDVKYVYTEVSHKEIYTGQVMFNELHNYILSNNFFLKNNLTMSGWQEDAIYIKKEYYDIVIPLGPKDIKIIHKCVEHVKKYVIGYRNIYIVSYDTTINIEGCITISESIFPFSIETVAKYHNKSERNGWYLQQLIKLYSSIYIPNILNKYLVIDSDVIFLKMTTFLNNENKPLYNYGTEYHIPYFAHMQRLNNNFTKVDINKSGICHHMLFETNIIQNIINIVEKEHNDNFYNVFLKNVTDINLSGASEYELYFNYILKYNSDNIIIRKLEWTNTNNPSDLFNNNYDYISYPWYMK